MGGAILPIVPVVCTGPVKYKGEEKLRIDIANVKAASKAVGVPDQHVFLPATAPLGVGINEYYKNDEEYFHALATELTRNTERSSPPAFCCKWTILFCQRSGERRSTLRRRMRRSAAFLPSAFAFTRAMASTRDLASTNRIYRRSLNTYSRSMPVLSALKLRTRDMNTNTTCSSG
jgi:hypothetical protein